MFFVELRGLRFRERPPSCSRRNHSQSCWQCE